MERRSWGVRQDGLVILVLFIGAVILPLIFGG